MLFLRAAFAAVFAFAIAPTSTKWICVDFMKTNERSFVFILLVSSAAAGIGLASKSKRRQNDDAVAILLGRFFSTLHFSSLKTNGSRNR